MEQKETSEEIDMLDLFHLIKRGFLAIGDVFLRFFNFLLRNIVVLIILVVVGVFIGWYLDGLTTRTYKTEVIVSTNLEGSGEYLNKVIGEIQFDLAKPDSLFLKKIGLSPEEAKRVRIEADPVLTLRSIQGNEKNYMDMIKDNNLLENDEMKAMFKKSAESHKITLYHPLSVNSRAVMPKILNYLRNNSYFEELSTDLAATLDDQIKSNAFVQKQIDSLFQNYAKNIGDKTALSENMSLFNNTLDLGSVLQFRLNMQRETLEAIKNRTKTNEFLRVIDGGKVQKVEHSSLHANIIKIPLVLIGLYFLAILLQIIYRKSREMEKRERMTVPENEV